MESCKIVSNTLRRDQVISVLSIGEVIAREVRAGTEYQCVIHWYMADELRRRKRSSHPDMINSSSTPYSFICCRPHPSLIRLGIIFFRQLVRFGVWYIRTSTRCEPNSVTNGTRRLAHDASGASRVPRKASVRIETLRSWLLTSACRIVDTYNASGIICLGTSSSKNWEASNQFMLVLPDIERREKYPALRCRNLGLE